MKPSRLLIAFGCLIALLAGITTWGGGVYQIHGDIKEVRHIRGGDRGATEAAHDFVRLTLPEKATIDLATDECVWNDSMGVWSVSGTAKFNQQERHYLCWMVNSGIEWQCERLEIDGIQRFPREE